METTTEHPTLKGSASLASQVPRFSVAVYCDAVHLYHNYYYDYFFKDELQTDGKDGEDKRASVKKINVTMVTS